MAELSILSVIQLSRTCAVHRPSKDRADLSGIELNTCLLIAFLLFLGGIPAEILWQAIVILVAAISGLTQVLALTLPRPVEASLAIEILVAVDV